MTPEMSTQAMEPDAQKVLEAMHAYAKERQGFRPAPPAVFRGVGMSQRMYLCITSGLIASFLPSPARAFEAFYIITSMISKLTRACTQEKGLQAIAGRAQTEACKHADRGAQGNARQGCGRCSRGCMCGLAGQEQGGDVRHACTWLDTHGAGPAGRGCGCAGRALSDGRRTGMNAAPLTFTPIHKLYRSTVGFGLGETNITFFTGFWV